MLKKKLLGRGNFDGSVGEQTNLIQFLILTLYSVYLFRESFWMPVLTWKNCINFVKKKRKKIPCVAYKI